MRKIYDIVILPNDPLSKKLAKDISRETKGVACDFVVDGKKLHYHMSLYHIIMPADRMVRLSSEVTEIAKEFQKFKVKTKAFRIFKNGVFVFEFVRNKTWEKMQKEIVQHCSPLRSGPIPLNPGQKISDKALEFRKIFGSPYLHPLMKPHFTMGKVNPLEDGQRILQKMKSKKFSFIADTVAVCEVDSNFQVTKVLKRYKLK